jgi:NTP pyrophosphatase (non-canonical NTP hydrolase)
MTIQPAQEALGDELADVLFVLICLAKQSDRY